MALHWGIASSPTLPRMSRQKRATHIRYRAPEWLYLRSRASRGPIKAAWRRNEITISFCSSAALSAKYSSVTNTNRRSGDPALFVFLANFRESKRGLSDPATADVSPLGAAFPSSSSSSRPLPFSAAILRPHPSSVPPRRHPCQTSMRPLVALNSQRSPQERPA
jgi:hypothetical protein